MLRNPALEAAVVADPDQEAAYLVYGDWLLDQGDPRGELSTVDRALAGDPWGDRGAELRARRASLFHTHRDELLGPLAPHVDARRLTLTWAHGFVREARIGWPLDPAGVVHDPVDLLQALLAHPSARLLHTLTLGPVPDPDPLALQRWIGALVAAAPPALRRLTIGTGLRTRRTRVPSALPQFHEVGPLAALSSAVPNLRELVVRGTQVSVAGLVLPALRRLDLGADDLASLDLAAFGALRELSLWGPGVDVEQWLARAPGPLALGLHDDPAANETVARLVASPALDRVTALDLSMSGLTQGRPVTAAAARLRRLTRLDVSLNRLTADSCARLTATLPGVAVGGQSKRTAPARLSDRVADAMDARLSAADAASTDGDADTTEAEAHLALRMAAWVGDLRREGRARAMLAWAAQERGRTAEAIAHAQRRVEIERDLVVSDPRGVEAAVVSLATFHRLRGDMRHAETLLDEAASAAALAERAYAVLVQGRAAEALALADRAVARAGDRVPWGVYNIRGAALQTLQRYDEAEQDYARAEPLAPDAAARAPIALNRAALAFLAGRPDDAAARTSAVIEAARQRRDTYWETRGLNQRGHWALNGGRFAEAEADLLETLRGYERLNDRASQGPVCQLLGDVCRRRLDLDRAQTFAERALALTRDCGLREHEASTMNLLGHLAEDREDLPRAIAWYEAALAIARDIGQPRAEEWHLTSLALAHLDAGEDARALEELHAALAITQSSGNRRWQGVCRSSIGRVRYAAGDFDGAIAEYDAAIALYEEVREPTAGARMLRALAWYCAGRRDEADAALREVAAATVEDRLLGRELAAIEAALHAWDPSRPAVSFDPRGVVLFSAWVHRGGALRRS